MARTIIKEDTYAFDKIYHQLEKMDFSNYVCSPLINGGCGLGKTTALTDDRMYELFKRKLGKEEPQVLVVESRSMVRDQLRIKNVNLNYTFLQFDKASKIDLSRYDIIIVDEAHSLFSDAEFAPRTTEPLTHWLNKSLCFQIYITASDLEFIGCASFYFDNKEWQPTFPDLENLHTRYVVETLYLSVSIKDVTSIINLKSRHFFKENSRGMFFIISAEKAYNLYRTYSELGYRCAFYISQQNKTQLSRRLNEDEVGYFEDEYGSTDGVIITTLKGAYDNMENVRKQLGKETVREALLCGRFPMDVDYLFITSTGQEGLSLNDIKLDFIFIEDCYPLTINQKVFRYRGNIKEVYLHMPQRRIQASMRKSLERAQKLNESSQEYLKGFYEGAKGTKNSQIIWLNPDTQKYEVAKSYIAGLQQKFQDITGIGAALGNDEELFGRIGIPAENRKRIGKEDEDKEILIDFFSDKNGVLLTEQIKGAMVTELIKRGLTNGKQNTDFTFDYVKKKCREYNVCDFIKASANKKDAANNPDIIYRNKYLKIKLL